MKKMALGICILRFLFVSTYSFAETQDALSLLENAQQESKKQQKIIKEREFEFNKKLIEKRRALEKLEKEITQIEKKSEQLENSFNSNESKLIEKQRK